MPKQLQFLFETEEIKEAEKENSFYNWCISNNMQNLLDEWDYEKNPESPKDVPSSGGHKKYWWKIHYIDPKTNKEYDFSWDSTISHRKEGKGCPYTSHPAKRLYKGFNDLETTNPELLEEWDYTKNTILPSEVIQGSSLKSWFICPKGHSYDMKIVLRSLENNGCPICAGKRILLGYNDLLSQNPELAKEWCYEKNDGGPECYTAKSNIPVYWKCLKNPKHIWKTTAANRVRQGTGCPYCSNKMVLVGDNDLATTHPESLKAWDYDKNTILPTKVTAGSNKKVWWKCEKGHSSKTTVHSRVIENLRCPYCAGVRVLEGYNDIQTKNPEILKEWDHKKNTIKPTEIAPMSRKKIWWLCSKGHSWQATPASRIGLNCGCPECAKPYSSSNSEKIIEVYLSKYIDGIETNAHPSFLEGRELDIYIPNLKLAIEYDGGRYHQEVERDIWKDNKCIEHEIELIRIRDYLCPKYDNQMKVITCAKTSGSYTELESPLIELVNYLNEKYYLSLPNDINMKRDIQSLLSLVDHRDYDNSVASSDVMDEWNFEKNEIKPESITQGNSKFKVWWKCKTCCYEWQAAPYVRIGMGCGCPACNHLVVSKGESLQDKYPEIASEWNYEKNTNSPSDVLPQSNIKVWWRCKTCGYEWETNPSHRTLKHSGCPLCAHQVVVTGINDLATLYPNIAIEWNYEKNTVSPTKISGGTSKKYWWKCHTCGFEWESVVASRTKRNTPCPACNNKQLFIGYNDILTKYPQIKDKWDYNKNAKGPEQYLSGSNEKVHWICDKGHEYTQTIYLQVVKQTGCPVCHNNRIITGVNDFATLQPELLKEWDFEKNEVDSHNISAGTDKKVWWKCINGHGWFTSIGQRVRYASGCPECHRLSRIKKK